MLKQVMTYCLIFLYTLGTSYLFEHSQLYRNRSYKTITSDSLKRLIIFIVIVLPMTLVHAFRYGFGVDYSGTYQSVFYQVKYGVVNINTSHVEIGYYLLNKIVAYFTNDYVWVLFWASILTFTVTFTAIYRFSNMLTLSLIMIFLSGFYFDATNIVRQEIATAFFLYSYIYIKNQKLIKFLICIMIGAFFHQSILFLIPLYFLNRVKINNKVWILITFAIYIFRNQINYWINNFVINGEMYHKYANYLNISISPELSYLFVTGGLLLILWVFVNQDYSMNMYVVMLYLGFIFSCLAAFIPYIGRFIQYSLASLVFIVPWMFNNMRLKYKTIGEILIFFILGSFTIYTVYIANWFGAVPYISIFNR